MLFTLNSDYGDGHVEGDCHPVQGSLQNQNTADKKQLRLCAHLLETGSRPYHKEGVCKVSSCSEWVVCRPLRKQGMGHARQENLYSQMHAAMKPALLAQGPHARRIEQGGRLVAAPPGGHTAILQMPRGNLETVCPRPLVVAAIADALQVNYCSRPQNALCESDFITKRM